MNYLLMISTLLSAIHTVETLMPASPGKDKFDACLKIVEAVVGDVSAHSTELQSLATIVVNGLRATGVFKTAAAAG